ncbi:hypothetical protein SBA3_910063 [Candidatus Sulfopaludibacter sp. SbA3]|nr:hypothetical protein SBA3_910063 [Candidatus Sulfopaludibacter sp. SbA3]
MPLLAAVPEVLNQIRQPENLISWVTSDPTGVVYTIWSGVVAFGGAAGHRFQVEGLGPQASQGLHAAR